MAAMSTTRERAPLDEPQVEFPKPFSLGENCTRWRLSDVLRFEAARAGTAAPEISPQDERYLSARDVARRLGVATSTIWRWAAEPCRKGEV